MEKGWSNALLSRKVILQVGETMISSINIHNFQSHRDTKLELDPGVNVIAGPSDSGKTAILRALNWAINNSPAGDGFRRYDTDDTSVTLEVDNLEIQRRKKGTKNLYRLGGEKFAAFGQGVPDPITEHLNIDDLNFHYQLAGPFLLSSTPGEVARYLNTIVSLDVIDRSLSNLRGKQLQATRSLRSTEERAIHLQEELNELKWVDEAEKGIDKLRQLETKAAGLEEQHDTLAFCITKIRYIQEEQTELGSVLKLKLSCDNLLLLSEKHDSLVEQKEGLESLLIKCERTNKERSKWGEMVEDLEQEFHSVMGSVKECPLCGSTIKE